MPTPTFATIRAKRAAGKGLKDSTGNLRKQLGMLQRWRDQIPKEHAKLEIQRQRFMDALELRAEEVFAKQKSLDNRISELIKKIAERPDAHLIKRKHKRMITVVVEETH